MKSDQKPKTDHVTTHGPTLNMHRHNSWLMQFIISCCPWQYRAMFLCHLEYYACPFSPCPNLYLAIVFPTREFRYMDLFKDPELHIKF